jgi:hypothetical protein
MNTPPSQAYDINFSRLDLASQLAETDALSLLSSTVNNLVDRPVNSALSSARRAHIVEGAEGDADDVKTMGRLPYLIHTQMPDTDPASILYWHPAHLDGLCPGS